MATGLRKRPGAITTQSIRGRVYPECIVVELRRLLELPAIAEIGGPIHALFNCAGLPGPPFSDVDTMLVNFAAMRHLAELCAEQRAAFA